MEDEGIQLDADMIEKNDGLRLIAKLLLNALYGKFGQRPYQTKVHLTTTAREFHKLLESETEIALSADHVSEVMDRIVMRKRAEFAKAPRTNCLPIAIFVTSYARLRLYEYMEQVVKVGGKILYTDTDSIFYVKKICAPGVIEGECLGQMKREYSNRRIIEMIMAGPKNYGFVHIDPQNESDKKAVLKIRGFNLNYATAQIINFYRMKAIIYATFCLDEYVQNNSVQYLFFDLEEKLWMTSLRRMQ